MDTRRFITFTSAAVLWSAAAVALAADKTRPGPQPMNQAAHSIEKNRVNNPDNQGLQNAQERIAENQDRFAEKRAAKTKPKDKKLKSDKPALAEKPGHIGKP
jgi:hypothetical protein